MIYTRDAERILKLSERTATRLGHEVVGTEHILLAIVCDADNNGADLLKNYPEVNAYRLRQLVTDLHAGLNHQEPPEKETVSDEKNEKPWDLTDILPKDVLPMVGKVGSLLLEDLAAKLRRLA